MEVRDLLKICNLYYSCKAEDYHTAYHIMDMLVTYSKFRTQLLKEAQAKSKCTRDISINVDKYVINAIVWHDSSYGVFDEHEVASADLYQRCHPTTCKAVELNAIMNTKITPDSTVDRNDIVACIVRDLDWSTFIDEYRCFDADKRIMNELCEKFKGVYTKKEVKQRRREFLYSLLDKEMFSTYTFKAYEKAAQSNIRKLLRQRYK